MRLIPGILEQAAANIVAAEMADEPTTLRRSIGIVFSDGGLFALTAVRAAGSDNHGDEEIAAILCDPDGAPVEMAEALLSTEYGEDGAQRRATLELWAEEDAAGPMRGSGTLISSCTVERPGLRAEVAFFRWSLEGREGLGHYEIVHPDA
jgi:hypothetical protein